MGLSDRVASIEPNSSEGMELYSKILSDLNELEKVSECSHLELWDKIRSYPLPKSVRKLLFTHAVNNGIGSAIKMAKEVCVEDEVIFRTSILTGDSADRKFKRATRASLKNYHFGERTFRFTKYQIYSLYRKRVKKLLRKPKVEVTEKHDVA